MNYEDMQARLGELEDLMEKHERAFTEIEIEIANLEFEIEQENESDWDEWRADDDRQRAADMNATLRDIGGGL